MTGHIEVADRMWKLGRHELAAEHYEKHLSVRPRDARVLGWLAQVLWQSGRKAEAHARLAEALGIDALNCNVHHAAARIHRWDGDWRKSLEHCERAVELHPSCDHHHLELSYTLEKGKRIEEAFREVLVALSLNPQDPDNHQQQVYLHNRYGKPEDAWRFCQDYLRVAPDRADAHARRGLCLDNLGRKQEGEQAYLDALAIDPNLHWARENLASLRKELGRVEHESKSRLADPPADESPFEEIHDALKSMGQEATALAFVLVLAAAFVALAAWTGSAILLGAKDGWSFRACLLASSAAAMLPWNHEYLSLLLQRLSGGAAAGVGDLLVDVHLHAMVALASVLALVAFAQSSWFLAYWALLPLALLPWVARLLGRRRENAA